MSWNFKLRPDSGTFPPDAKASMRAYLLALPSYERADGLIVVRPDQEYVQMALARVNEPPSPPSVWFFIEAEVVVCGVWGPSDLNIVTADFVRYCQANWPCTFYEEGGEPVAIERFESWSERNY